MGKGKVVMVAIFGGCGCTAIAALADVRCIGRECLGLCGSDGYLVFCSVLTRVAQGVGRIGKTAVEPKAGSGHLGYATNKLFGKIVARATLYGGSVIQPKAVLRRPVEFQFCSSVLACGSALRRFFDHGKFGHGVGVAIAVLCSVVVFACAGCQG